MKSFSVDLANTELVRTLYENRDFESAQGALIRILSPTLEGPTVLDASPEKCCWISNMPFFGQSLSLKLGEKSQGTISILDALLN